MFNVTTNSHTLAALKNWAGRDITTINGVVADTLLLTRGDRMSKSGNFYSEAAAKRYADTIKGIANAYADRVEKGQLVYDCGNGLTQHGAYARVLSA